MPINFRLTGAEVRYIVENAEAAALIVQDELAGIVEEVRADLPVPSGNLIHFGKAPCPAGYRAYEDLIAAASDGEPEQQVAPGRPMDADVHLGHDRQAQGRAAQPPGGRAAVAVHRDRARPAPA